MVILFDIIILLLLSWAIVFFQPRLWIWVGFVAIGILALYFSHLLTLTVAIILWVILGIIGISFGFSILHRRLISHYLFQRIKNAFAPMSETEKTALNAGGPWWEQDLFQGKPDWAAWEHIPLSQLNQEEHDFLNNETEQLCSMLDDWKIVHKDKDLPESVWQFIRDNGFFGIVIDPEYGGKGFSAIAHSAVVMKIATRSLTAAVTVMVPNSLGPGELLHHYGTEEQKQRYLPALAKGKEIPCFALTGPEVGSDATSMPDKGIVCYGEINGERTLGIQLQFEKRYITLAPVATLIGLAFKLYDPAHLLGDQESLGITCALLSSKTPGLKIGQRHIPLDLAFMNGTISGDNVFIPIDAIIGGQKMAGEGWRMLVECLSIGRSISLPAISTGYSAFAYLTTSSYACLRRQFNLPIGKLEGVQEALANIGGYSYLLDACRLLTLTAVDQNQKPSVASAIAKYHMTELGRKVMNHAMDIHGGRGIMMGPRNYLARAYQGMPICITVEGANILTRNLMIFGQGAMCCHPFIRQEIEALSQGLKGLKRFDNALFKHLGYSLNNIARASWHGLSAGLTIPAIGSTLNRYKRQINRMSTAYALVSDVALVSLGGALKRKERLSARLGDVLSYCYLATATVRYFQHHQCPQEEKPFAEWAIQYCLYEAQTAFYALLDNLPNRALAKCLQWLCFPWGRPFKAPSDKLSQTVATQMLQPSSLRYRYKQYCHIPDELNDPVGCLEIGFQHFINAQKAENALKAAIRSGEVSKDQSRKKQILAAQKHHLLSDEQAQKLLALDDIQQHIVQVDAFDFHLQSPQ